MRLLPEIRVPFDNVRSRVGNTGASFADEIESGIRKIVAEELLSRRPTKAVDEGIQDGQSCEDVDASHADATAAKAQVSPRMSVALLDPLPM